MQARSQPWLGTLVSIQIFHERSEADLLAAFAGAFDAISAVHRLMSFHDPLSDLSRINRAPVGARLAVHARTWAVLQAAQDLSLSSQGLFDIRVGARLMAWSVLPPLFEAPPNPAPNRLALDLSVPRQVTKLTNDVLDLGGIAKGAAVDAAIEALERQGIKQACVNAGGDLRAIGERPVTVHLRDAANPAHLGHQVTVQGHALATSSPCFSRTDTARGPVSALVHGQTGEALLNALSVSVVAPLCLHADALTKVVMASGNAHHPCLARHGAQGLILPARGATP